MTRTFIVNGSSIHDIPSFYAEINRLFMAEEDWRIGNSLDALDDLFYGGYGAMGNAPARLVWEDMAQSRQALGYAVTKAYYEAKLGPDSVFNQAFFKAKLQALEAGNGETYFDLIIKVIQDHPHIELVPA